MPLDLKKTVLSILLSFSFLFYISSIELPILFFIQILSMHPVIILTYEYLTYPHLSSAIKLQLI